MKIRFSFLSYEGLLSVLMLILISTSSFADSVSVIGPYARAVPPG